MADAVDVGGLRAVHVVGAGGAGMSAIATILASMGKRVSGTDLKDSAALRRLSALGVDVRVGHTGEALGEVDAVAISTAVPPSNPEVVAAHERGIPVLRRADILAAICRSRRTVGVAGTHGKTTTSSMLSLILVEAGLHPSFLVGGDLNEVGGGAVWDADHLDAPFVVEADESDGTFIELGASAALVTSVEPDHLDHWGSFEALTDAFTRFVAEANGPNVVGTADPGAAALAARTHAISYGEEEGARWRMVDITTGRDGTRFTVLRDGAAVAELTVAVPGRYNARNALGAMAMAVELGAAPDAAVRALGRYAGVARRWQHRGEAAGVTFVDDYAHLPTEVANVIATAKEGGWQRVVVVFQPHRFTRTGSLWREFADSFVAADELVVTDIYPAGEAPRPGVTGKLIVDAVTGAHPDAPVVWVPARRDLITHLAGFLRSGDLCLTLGAGDLTALPDEVIAALRS